MSLYIIQDERNRPVGLFSYVLQAFHNLSAIDGSDDKIHIDYSGGLPYKDANYGDNVWEYYFKQPFGLTEDEMQSATTICGFINNGRETPFTGIPRPTDEVVSLGRSLCKKYIRMQPYILEKVDEFLTINELEKYNYFAIHRRGTDHGQDAPILPMEDYYREADVLFEEYDKCVLCTDEIQAVDGFKARYGDKVCSYDSIRSNDKKGVHWSVGLKSPYKMGEDVVIESLLMANSGFLVKTVSGVSIFSSFYNENLIYKDIDLHLKNY